MHPCGGGNSRWWGFVLTAHGATLTTNAPRSVYTARVNHQPNEFVKCTFNHTYEVPRAAAMQMVQMQAWTQEYRKEISELQIQMSHLISSTWTHLNMQNSTAPHKQKTVNFRDTFSMQYPPETSSEVNEQSAALNANRQRETALNVNRQHETALNGEATPYRPQQVPVQTHATWQPQANLLAWRESGRRENQPSLSQSRYSAGTNTLHHPPNVDIGRTVRQWKLQFSGAES